MGLAFTHVVDAAPNTLITSDTAYVSGLTLGTKNVTVVGVGELSVDGGAWGATGVVQNGTGVRVRVTTPASELGEVTTVTVDVQSLGYVEWTVTNANTLLVSDGSGYDTVGWFVVTPAPLFTEVAVGTAEIVSATSFVLVDEVGTADTEGLSFAVTATATVLETGTGAGAGFPSVSEVVDDAGEGEDSFEFATAFVVDEVGTGESVTTNTATFRVTLDSVAAGTGDALGIAHSALVVEAGVGEDAATPVVLLGDDVFEFGSGVDVTLASAVVTATVDDMAAGSEELTPKNTVRINYDNVGYGFDDVLLSYPTHGAWVFNARTMAISRWDSIQVTEVHEANGVVYGLAPDGMYVLSPTVASAARADSGLYDFGVIETKRLRHIYLTYTAKTPIHIEVTRSNGGGKTTTTYGKSAYDHEAPTQVRVELGRGPVSRYWGFSFLNTDAGFASLKEARLVPNVTSRRI